MAKLRFDPNTGNPEWEGTPEELLSIYAGLKQRFGNIPQNENVTLRQHAPTPKYLYPKSDYAELATKMPTVEQLVAYILSKPKFEHDIVDVGKKFFGKQLHSRKYEKLYRELRAKLETARKSIEESERGAFERIPTRHRNLPAYIFKKVSATPLDTTLQKKHPSP